MYKSRIRHLIETGCDGTAYTELYAELAKQQDDMKSLEKFLSWEIEETLNNLADASLTDTAFKRFVLGRRIRKCTELYTLVSLELDDSR